MSVIYRRKIRLKKPSRIKNIKPRLELDTKNIQKNINIKAKPIKKPVDLANTMTEIKHKFYRLISPIVSGEYKKNSRPRFVYDSAKKTIKLRYQLMSIKENVLDFVFQLRLYVISQSPNKDKIKEVEKEIKEWEKIISKTLNEIIDNISFVIENYFVPIVNKLEKKEVSS
jgi:hypothetical protein